MRVTLAAMVVVVAVGGCSSSTHSRVPVESVVTSTPEANVPPDAAESPKETATPAPTKAAPRRSPAKRVRVARLSSGRFVTTVQRQMPQFVLDRRDDEVAELGEMACRSLASGKSKTAVAKEITEYGVRARDARELVTLARGTAC
jgi:hypothetical protein